MNSVKAMVIAATNAHHKNRNDFARSQASQAVLKAIIDAAKISGEHTALMEAFDELNRTRSTQSMRAVR